MMRPEPRVDHYLGLDLCLFPLDSMILRISCDVLLSYLYCCHKPVNYWKLEDLNLGLLSGDPKLCLEINDPCLWLGGPSYVGLSMGRAGPGLRLSNPVPKIGRACWVLPNPVPKLNGPT